MVEKQTEFTKEDALKLIEILKEMRHQAFIVGSSKTIELSRVISFVEFAIPIVWGK